MSHKQHTLIITPASHSNCCGTLCFCCGALCKVPIQSYLFLIEVLPYQREIAVPLLELSSRPKIVGIKDSQNPPSQHRPEKHPTISLKTYHFGNCLQGPIS